MGTKLKPAEFDCYANAAPDEPMFVLLARDLHAPYLVRQWAHHRSMQIDNGVKPDSDRAMVGEALRCAAEMEEWRRKHRDGMMAVSETLRSDPDAAP